MAAAKADRSAPIPRAGAVLPNKGRRLIPPGSPGFSGPVKTPGFQETPSRLNFYIYFHLLSPKDCTIFGV
jgi:hypothetical protein